MVKWAYILIGDNGSGKTSFQKDVLWNLYNKKIEKLNCNVLFPITSRIGTRNAQTISCMSRSFQEKQQIGDYKDIANFFNSHFRDADIAILSSWLKPTDINEMITELKRRFFNVEAVFFENSIAQNESINQEISLLDWNERYFLENKLSEKIEDCVEQIQKAAIDFSYHILSKG